MAQANAQQIQQYVNDRIRVRSEQVRALLNAMKDDKNAIDDIYSGVTGSQSGWVDSRTDGPPSLASANDVLNYNAFITQAIALLDGTSTDGANFAALKTTLLKMCVRPA